MVGDNSDYERDGFDITNAEQFVKTKTSPQPSPKERELEICSSTGARLQCVPSCGSMGWLKRKWSVTTPTIGIIAQARRHSRQVKKA